MSGVHLTGLEGTNPLGFLAALGVQVAFASEPEQPRLWWSDDIVPHAVVDRNFSIDRVADQAMKVFAQWKDSPAVSPRRPDGSAMSKGDELKLTPEDTRIYLSLADECESWSALITALVAEGSLDNNGAAKPSDLYFTAGNQKFLKMVRNILQGVSLDDVLAGLRGPWKYESKMESLKWDVSDDRVYALMAYSPGDSNSPDRKLTNPGPEALSILGLTLHPVFGSRGRTLTQGWSGSWMTRSYAWPIWRNPASPYAVKSLLAHASTDVPTATERHRWFGSWGLIRVLRSSVRPSGQGYGTFGPPEVTWQAR
jgi:hypothetical protein